DDVYNHGHNIKKLYSDLIEHFRNLLVVRMGKKLDRLLDVPAHETKMMADQVGNLSEIYLSQLLDILFKEESSIRYSEQPKLALEMVFIRMFQAKPVLPIDTLIEKLDNLKKGIYDDVPANYRETADRDQIREQQATDYRQKATDNEQLTTDNRQPTTDNRQLTTDNEQPTTDNIQIAFNPADTTEKTWEKLIGVISDKSPALGAGLTKCMLKNLDDRGMEIEVAGNGFNFSRISKKEDVIKAICSDFFGKEMKIVISAAENQEDDKKNEKKREDSLRQEAMHHPLVEAALEIFDGRVTDVKIYSRR
ncbi:hypothetical protein QUF80_23370, partial [Desulfococcaceae bacterium HSG8]|nr:hypothetical protein [Desulfococcaceae bacterium HSG8]